MTGQLRRNAEATESTPRSQSRDHEGPSRAIRVTVFGAIPAKAWIFFEPTL